MPYWQLFYHLVWATKDRAPLITETVEARIHELIRSKAVGLGAKVFALNSMPDHTHFVAAVPPSIAIAEFVGKVKGVSASCFNKDGMYESMLRWQPDYSVFSFSGQQLPRVIAYVTNQKRHHTEQTTIPLLERIGEATGNRVCETDARYGTDIDWLIESDLPVIPE